MNIRYSASQLFTTILFISLFAMSTRTVLDADVWWHLRTGQWIVDNRTIPHEDPFSLNFQGESWTAHEWLSEIFLILLYKLGGLKLLAFSFAGIITISYSLPFIRSPGKPYVAGFATVLGAIASAPIWGVRPQMITLMLFSIFLFLIEMHFKTNKAKYLYPLPFLMIAWVNFHAGYMLGIVLCGTYLIFKWLERYFPYLCSDDTAEIRPTYSLIPTLLVLVLCLMAVGLNPNGYYMLIYPFDTLTSQAMMTLIEEWLSPNFHNLEWLPFATLIISVMAIGLFSQKRSSITDIALLAILGYASLRSMRNVPIFAIAVIPILSHHLDGVIRISTTLEAPTRKSSIINIILVAIIFIVSLTHVLSIVERQAPEEKEKFPVSATEWIRTNKPKGMLFNTYGWGGYLIWNLYPDYKVFIDGRADLYGDEYMREFLATYNADPRWEKRLRESNVNIALVETNSPISSALSENPEWKLVLRTDLESLFARQAATTHPAK